MTKPKATLAFAASPTVTLLVDNGITSEYDVRNGRFKDTLNFWKRYYKVKFPKDSSFAEFYQLFKEYL